MKKWRIFKSQNIWPDMRAF